MSPKGSRNLQGASRVTGGFARGRALGNVFNHADVSELQQELDLMLAIRGKVHLYETSGDSEPIDPTAKPHKIVKVDVAPTLGPVLEKIANKYSPIKSKSFFSLLNLTLTYSQKTTSESTLLKTMSGKLKGSSRRLWMPMRRSIG